MNELIAGGGCRCGYRWPGHASALSHQGVDVRVYEQARQLGEVGAGVALVSNDFEAEARDLVVTARNYLSVTCSGRR